MARLKMPKASEVQQQQHCYRCGDYVRIMHGLLCRSK
jgi:hypothetical protein